MLICAELTWSSHTVSPPSPPLTGTVLSSWRGCPAWSESPASLVDGDCFQAAGCRCGEGWSFSSLGQLAGRRSHLGSRGRCRGGTACMLEMLGRTRVHTHHRKYQWLRADRYIRRFLDHMMDARFPPCYSHKLRTRCEFIDNNLKLCAIKGLKTLYLCLHSQIHCRSGFPKWFSPHSSHCLPPNSERHGHCPVTWTHHRFNQ